MKNERLESCLSFIRFSLESEGNEISAEQEEVFKSILNGDITSTSVVNDWVKTHGLQRVEISSSNPFARYPGTRVQENFFDIHSKDELSEVDHILSMFRIAGLFDSPVLEMPLSIDLLKVIHKEMFRDVYPSAGLFRTSSSAKKAEFATPENIPFLLEELFKKLESTEFLRNLEDDDSDFINELAYIMGELEAIHPFADGNGRIIRFFITLLAERNGYGIGWDSADPDQVLEASIAAIDGDYQALVDNLEEICYQFDED